MSFRSRALLALVASALAPLLLFGLGVRGELERRLAAAHQRRVESLVGVIVRDLRREAAAVDRRLAALAATLPEDDRLRLALLGHPGADGRYLLDYASRAMRIAGLDALQLHDSAGRILSSGQFRNDFGRLEPELVRGIDRADTVLLARFRTPDGAMLTLARAADFTVGGVPMTLAGGVRVNGALLERFSTAPELSVTLALPDDTVGTSIVPSASAGEVTAVVREIELPFLRRGDAGSARLRIHRVGDEAAAVRRSVDAWFAAASLLVALAAIALGVWLSRRLTRPLTALADATGAITLSAGEAIPGTERPDEIGVLARRLTAMSRRLRAGAEALRTAERRATMGEIARQVNHDIKNGLVPIRNVLRHLGEVQEREPGALAHIYGERRHTLEASVGYLDALARRYARLAPRADPAPVNIVAAVGEVVRSAQAGGAAVRLEAGESLPRISLDALALRRMVDNLVRNAVESLEDTAGTVIVRVSSAAHAVRISVSDTGRGMSREELARAFDDFHTTKPNGTGLGLSVVRRLTSDIGARLHVESAPGRGTTITIDLPVGPAPPSSLVAGRLPVTASRLQLP